MDSDFSSDHDESENISSDHDESENISSDHGESENISVQNESEVSSLQMSCLCYIARHVQEFPVWHLASLPKRLRIDVLRFLPAVDICRLEEGPVSADDRHGVGGVGHCGVTSACPIPLHKSSLNSVV